MGVIRQVCISVPESLFQRLFAERVTERRVEVIGRDVTVFVDFLESVLNVDATFAPRRSVDFGDSIEIAQIGDLCLGHVGHGPLPADDHAVLNGNGGKSSGWAGKTKREDERKEQRKS